MPSLIWPKHGFKQNSFLTLIAYRPHFIHCWSDLSYVCALCRMYIHVPLCVGSYAPMCAVCMWRPAVEAGCLPLWISTLLPVAVVSIFVLFSWFIFIIIIFKLRFPTEPGACSFS